MRYSNKTEANFLKKNLLRKNSFKSRSRTQNKKSESVIPSDGHCTCIDSKQSCDQNFNHIAALITAMRYTPKTT